MSDQPLNVIPTYTAGGNYEALNPFDAVVVANKYYTAEAIRSVSEMQGRNFNLQQHMFDPAGVTESDGEQILTDLVNRNGAIITLIGADGSRVYVPTTYLKSYPLVDGVLYERLCVVIDYGAVPPDLKDKLAADLEHYKAYTANSVGVDAEVKIGTMPTIGYVTKEQAEVFEQTRLNKIAGQVNDVQRLAQLEQQVATQAAYIVELETALANR